MLKHSKGGSAAHETEEDLIERALGHLYSNPQARRLLKKRLGNRDIRRMSESELYTIVAAVIREITRS